MEKSKYDNTKIWLISNTVAICILALSIIGPFYTKNSLVIHTRPYEGRWEIDTQPKIPLEARVCLSNIVRERDYWDLENKSKEELIKIIMCYDEVIAVILGKPGVDEEQQDSSTGEN